MGNSQTRDFEILSRLGKGAFGEVFKIEDKKTGEVCVLKKIKVRNKEEKAVAQQEAQMLQSLDHPNLVKGYSFFEHSSWMPFRDKVIGIVAEYCDRGSLAEAMPQLSVHHYQRLPELQIIGIFAQIVACIQYLHNQKIMHRDLKLENILVKSRTGKSTKRLDEQEIKVCDLGLASLTVDTLGNARTTSSFAGTKPYMAPEIKQQVPYTFPADVYSLGVVLAELITARRCWTTRDLRALVRSCRDVSLPLRKLCLRMLCDNPDARPTINDVASTLPEITARLHSWEKYVDKLADGDAIVWSILAVLFVLVALFVSWLFAL